MINWKVVVGSGAVAIVLSLLTGIISGVSFGTLFVRAVMWGALFCGAGAGVSYLISKYLPELESIPNGQGAKADEGRPSVDIVLPDENPHDTSDEPSESDAGFEEGETGTDSGAMDSDQIEEVSGGESVGTMMVEEVEEAHRDRGGVERIGESRIESAGDLPDLDDEEDGVAPGGSQRGFQEQGLADIASVSSRGSRIDVMGHQADTEEIAKAIRTAIKKDEKG